MFVKYTILFLGIMCSMSLLGCTSTHCDKNLSSNDASGTCYAKQYIVAQGDHLKVTIDDLLSGHEVIFTEVVNSKGLVHYPVIGTIRAEGLPLKVIRDTIDCLNELLMGQGQFVEVEVVGEKHGHWANVPTQWIESEVSDAVVNEILKEAIGEDK